MINVGPDGLVAKPTNGGRAWPQRFTKRQPDDDQLEVAIAALEGAVHATDAPTGAGASVARAA